MLNLNGRIEIEQASSSRAGPKPRNDDALEIYVPNDCVVMTNKGIVATIADGVSSAEGGQQAARFCTTRFIKDYYETPDLWSTKTSGQNTVVALNRELVSGGLHFDKIERGLVCTSTTLVLKSRTAHIFHVGDTRVYRLRNNHLEQLSTDHTTPVNANDDYLSRAMGLAKELSCDYICHSLEEGDHYLLTTDGVHRHLSTEQILAELAAATGELATKAKALTRAALDAGSNDNASCVVIKVTKLPLASIEDTDLRLSDLPFPPPLNPGDCLDGLRVLEEIHASSRSQIYLVQHRKTEARYIMKTPSPNFEDDRTYIEQFVLESWIGSRINNPHISKIVELARPKTCLYYLAEYIEGQTLASWAQERGPLTLPEARGVLEQLAAGLRALHRKEVLHQDLKPDNIMIDRNGQVKIIDFGSCRAAGFEELRGRLEPDAILGTIEYTAPEYRLGLPTGSNSDLFSLGCIAYELLTRQQPYGRKFETARTKADFKRLVYRPAYHHNSQIPIWVDGALEMAVMVDSTERYQASSKFIEDLRNPNPQLTHKHRRPLMESNPLLFWKLATAAFAALTLIFFILFVQQKKESRKLESTVVRPNLRPPSETTIIPDK